jgi:hypothetical protein
MSKRYEVLGLENLQHRVSLGLRQFDSSHHGLKNYRPEQSQLDVRLFDVWDCPKFASYKHLGFDIGAMDVGQLINEGAEIAVDYFYGDFLQTNTNVAFRQRKAPDNNSLSWFDVYRDGLFLTYLAKNDMARRKMIEWIEPWLPFDSGSYFVTVHDNNYHKLLAEFLRDGKITSHELEQEFGKCRKTGPKLMFACLTAIRENNAEAIALPLKKLLDNYLKTDYYKGSSTLSCAEGSIIWHVARDAGLDVNGLSEKQAALIMTRESLGLAA